MATQTTTCVLVRCDGCNTPAGVDDTEHGTVWHFGDVVEAYRRVREAGWYAERDRTVCRACLAVEACARMGHRWTGWRDTTVLGGLLGRRMRLCTCCGDVEYDDAPPTTRGKAAA